MTIAKGLEHCTKKVSSEQGRKHRRTCLDYKLNTAIEKKLKKARDAIVNMPNSKEIYALSICFRLSILISFLT
ncbi:CLUMA_CG010133, isoform A [Clunio marinus]|uniref:CLUMA_CG010133, isoform A n=1 Tax=Clunio marinus TaxID=568069 RepID=A0A1J1ICD1_9DIPT|nr:CLUMA_CG010133, isoform A [Clunio marinus]